MRTWWRTSTGNEVDFIIDDPFVAIEVKSSKRITSDHLISLRTFASEYPEIQKRIVVSGFLREFRKIFEFG